MTSDSLVGLANADSRSTPFGAASLDAFLELVQNWCLPSTLRDAGLVVLYGRHSLLPTDVPQATRSLAEAISAITPPADAAHGLGRVATYGRWMRELFLHAYGGSEAPLISLALQLAALRACAHSAVESHTRARIAREAEAVFLPVAELLGLWVARAELAERAQQLLRPGQFEVARRELEAARLQREQLFAEVAALLAPACASGSGVSLSLGARTPASVLRRERAGEERERMLGTVKIDALAADAASLALFREQAAAALSRRFSAGNHRANLTWQEQRRFNGFHLWALLVASDNPGAPLIRLRAFTSQMAAVNQFGIATRYSQPKLPAAAAWWNSPPPQALFEPTDGMIAVFSRMGETVHLPDGATVLDFAYTVRSDLLDHCTRVWVNGEPGGLARRLAPGDLVEIETDRRFRGPLPAWEQAAFLPEHRRRLRRAISQRADHAEQGRQQVSDAIAVRCLAHGLPTPGEQELLRFLDQVARRFNFLGVEALCVALSSPELRDRHLTPTVAQVASFYIANRIGAMIVCADGTPVLRRYPRLRLAGAESGRGSPVRPGTPIAGRLRHPDSGHEELLVQPKPEDASGDGLLTLAWRPTRVEGSSYLVTIDAIDRQGLLGDILRLIYDHHVGQLQLRQVLADTDQPPYARILLTLAAADPAPIDQLRARLSGLGGEERMRVVVEQEQQGQAPENFESVPYTTSPVSHPELFLGRSSETRKILWAVTSGEHLVVVGGPSRIGKTSLLHWLANREFPLHQIRPVQLHLGSSNFTPASFWRALIDGVRESLKLHTFPGLPLPRLQLDGDDPFETAVRLLEQLTRGTPRQRVVLLIDEFTALHDHWAPQSAGQVALQLGALLERLQLVTALLVVHDPLYAIGEVTPELARLLQRGIQVRLDHLDHESARRLIVKPVEQLVTYDERLVTELVRLTDGHPYLLQYALMALHSHVAWQGAHHATAADLDVAVADLLGAGRHVFRHHRELLPPPAAAVAWAIARCTRGNGSCDPAQVRAELARIARPTRATTVAAQVASLQAAGLLVPGEAELQFRVPLFARWLAGLARPNQI